MTLEEVEKLEKQVDATMRKIISKFIWIVITILIVGIIYVITHHCNWWQVGYMTLMLIYFGFLRYRVHKYNKRVQEKS
jgi:Ca2+/Na+ antiporter